MLDVEAGVSLTETVSSITYSLIDSSYFTYSLGAAAGVLVFSILLALFFTDLSVTGGCYSSTIVAGFDAARISTTGYFCCLCSCSCAAIMCLVELLSSLRACASISSSFSSCSSFSSMPSRGGGIYASRSASPAYMLLMGIAPALD